MSITQKQKDEIIKLYAESIENENDTQVQYAHLLTLKNTFGQSIPDWLECLKAYPAKNGGTRVAAAIAAYEAELEAQSRPKEEPIQYITLPTPEERAAAAKDFDKKRFNYALMMSLLDGMYRRDEVDLETYYNLQDTFSEYYGISKTSLFWWNGPHKGKDLTQKHRKNKSYTKRNTEYWAKFEKSPE